MRKIWLLLTACETFWSSCPIQAKSFGHSVHRRRKNSVILLLIGEKLRSFCSGACEKFGHFAGKKNGIFAGRKNIFGSFSHSARRRQKISVILLPAVEKLR
jgi:hypothetical protein